MTDTTTHIDPALAVSRAADWARGVGFETFLPTAEQNADLWNGVWTRARVEPSALSRLEAVPGDWKLLVISEDWCGDASNSVPVLARLAEQAPNLELRLVPRDADEASLALIDAHLTDGRSRSIPVAILLDAHDVERGWWGPRPAELQRWVMSDGQTLEKDERYRQARLWYARDRGRATVDEVVSLIEAASGAMRVG